MKKITEIKREEILVRLSNTRVRRVPSRKMNLQIDKMLELAMDLIEEKTSYQIFDRSEFPDKPYFDSAIKIGLAICTIGPALPDLTEKYMREGRLSDGVILDAIGSVAADQLSDIINEKIIEDTKELGLVPSMRYSPGYCDMGVEDQNLIFDRIDNVGVTLTPSKMMVPVKSVSFAINLGEKYVNRCRNCEKRDNCPDRR